jgi:hydroxypyruvate reductase
MPENLKQEASSILLNSLRKIDIAALVKQKVQLRQGRLSFGNRFIELADFDEILLIGFGKASFTMGSAVESLFVGYPLRGILVSNRKTQQELKSEVLIAGHPTPNANSLLAARKILAALESASARSLVLFLISGGGSSLVELPLEGISLEEMQQVNRTLVGCGATIQEINLIRKQLSGIKGGKLAQKAKDLNCLALYLSDVNRGDLASLASGPLFVESGSAEWLTEIIEKYDLLRRLPAKIAAFLQPEATSASPTTGSPARENISHLLLLENADLLEIAGTLAEDRGFQVEICDDLVEGNYREIADELLRRLALLQGRFANRKVCLISGGEVSCPVQADGIGGRNQEFVLYSATRFSNLSNNSEVVVLSCGTDGIDGVSCAAGAMISNSDFDSSTEPEASAFIEQNDSHSFLKQSGGLLVLGPTGNNVRDLRMLLARPKQ